MCVETTLLSETLNLLRAPGINMVECLTLLLCFQLCDALRRVMGKENMFGESIEGYSWFWFVFVLLEADPLRRPEPW